MNTTLKMISFVVANSNKPLPSLVVSGFNNSHLQGVYIVNSTIQTRFRIMCNIIAMHNNWQHF